MPELIPFLFFFFFPLGLGLRIAWLILGFFLLLPFFPSFLTLLHILICGILLIVLKCRMPLGKFVFRN